MATDAADTIADGIAVRVPVPEAVADLDGLVDDVALADRARLAGRRVAVVACGSNVSVEDLLRLGVLDPAGG